MTYQNFKWNHTLLLNLTCIVFVINDVAASKCIQCSSFMSNWCQDPFVPDKNPLQPTECHTHRLPISPAGLYAVDSMFTVLGQGDWNPDEKGLGFLDPHRRRRTIPRDDAFARVRRHTELQAREFATLLAAQRQHSPSPSYEFVNKEGGGSRNTTGDGVKTRNSTFGDGHVGQNSIPHIKKTSNYQLDILSKKKYFADAPKLSNRLIRLSNKGDVSRRLRDTGMLSRNEWLVPFYDGPYHDQHSYVLNWFDIHENRTNNTALEKCIVDHIQFHRAVGKSLIDLTETKEEIDYHIIALYCGALNDCFSLDDCEPTMYCRTFYKLIPTLNILLDVFGNNFEADTPQIAMRDALQDILGNISHSSIESFYDADDVVNSNMYDMNNEILSTYYQAKGSETSDELSTRPSEMEETKYLEYGLPASQDRRDKLIIAYKELEELKKIKKRTTKAPLSTAATEGTTFQTVRAYSTATPTVPIYEQTSLMADILSTTVTATITAFVPPTTSKIVSILKDVLTTQSNHLPFQEDIFTATMEATPKTKVTPTTTKNVTIPKDVLTTGNSHLREKMNSVTTTVEGTTSPSTYVYSKPSSEVPTFQVPSLTSDILSTLRETVPAKYEPATKTEVLSISKEITTQSNNLPEQDEKIIHVTHPTKEAVTTPTSDVSTFGVTSLTSAILATTIEATPTTYGTPTTEVVTMPKDVITAQNIRSQEKMNHDTSLMADILSTTVTTTITAFVPPTTTKIVSILKDVLKTPNKHLPFQEDILTTTMEATPKTNVTPTTTKNVTNPKDVLTTVNSHLREKMNRVAAIVEGTMSPSTYVYSKPSSEVPTVLVPSLTSDILSTGTETVPIKYEPATTTEVVSISKDVTTQSNNLPVQDEKIIHVTHSTKEAVTNPTSDVTTFGVTSLTSDILGTTIEATPTTYGTPTTEGVTMPKDVITAQNNHSQEKTNHETTPTTGGTSLSSIYLYSTQRSEVPTIPFTSLKSDILSTTSFATTTTDALPKITEAVSKVDTTTQFNHLHEEKNHSTKPAMSSTATNKCLLSNEDWLVSNYSDGPKHDQHSYLFNWYCDHKNKTNNTALENFLVDHINRHKVIGKPYLTDNEEETEYHLFSMYCVAHNDCLFLVDCEPTLYCRTFYKLMPTFKTLMDVYGNNFAAATPQTAIRNALQAFLGKSSNNSMQHFTDVSDEVNFKMQAMSNDLVDTFMHVKTSDIHDQFVLLKNLSARPLRESQYLGDSLPSSQASRDTLLKAYKELEVFKKIKPWTMAPLSTTPEEMTTADFSPTKISAASMSTPNLTTNTDPTKSTGTTDSHSEKSTHGTQRNDSILPDNISSTNETIPTTTQIILSTMISADTSEMSAEISTSFPSHDPHNHTDEEKQLAGLKNLLKTLDTVEPKQGTMEDLLRTRLNSTDLDKLDDQSDSAQVAAIADMVHHAMSQLARKVQLMRDALATLPATWREGTPESRLFGKASEFAFEQDRYLVEGDDTRRKLVEFSKAVDEFVATPLPDEPGFVCFKVNYIGVREIPETFRGCAMSEKYDICDLVLRYGNKSHRVTYCDVCEAAPDGAPCNGATRGNVATSTNVEFLVVSSAGLALSWR